MEKQEGEHITSLLGKTLTEIQGKVHGEKLVFVVDDGSVYVMQHEQECCEDVRIEDICGHLQDLVGSPIVRAEAPSSVDYSLRETGEEYTWTFYILGTVKGTVTIRWCGMCGGPGRGDNYATDVTLRKIKEGIE